MPPESPAFGFIWVDCPDKLSASQEINDAHEMIIANAKNIFFINKVVENLTIACLLKKNQVIWPARFFGTEPFWEVQRIKQKE